MSLNPTPPIFEPARPPDGEFTLEELQGHLQTAIYVEMSTIPLYLYAYYSIKDGDHGSAARRTIMEVCKEEMLHLALAGNTLYALGKIPTLYGQTFIPKFPEDILYTKIKMSLRDGRQENIQTFVDIEAPSAPVKPKLPAIPEYKSIGEFYQAIQTQLRQHGSSIREGTNQISLNDSIWYRDDLIVVSNLQQALDAMETIIIQGEGGDGGHHLEFLKLRESSNPWEWYPVPENPQTESYSDKKFYEVLLTFDAAYCYLVLNIERLYQVSGNKRGDCSANIRGIMAGILTPLAEFLRKEQVDANTVAGPCFNYYPFDSRDPLISLKNEIATAVTKYTAEQQVDLERIQGRINGLKQLPAVD
ncbi:hypothetical protein BYT27DRAFT_7158652 [Phlegmacium glaucopus]|nr:hypothetical protein BYT27DRAFT_7158652 [Phlegmacium glaucopus]